MPYQRLALLVLNEWRLVERRLATLDATSPEGEQLVAEAHALRDEYKHLIAEAAAHRRPLPEPLPETPEASDRFDAVLDAWLERFQRPGRSHREQGASSASGDGLSGTPDRG